MSPLSREPPAPSGIIHVLVVGTASDTTRELVATLALSRIAVGWADDLAQIRRARRELRPAVVVFDLTSPVQLPLQEALAELRHNPIVGYGPPLSAFTEDFRDHPQAEWLNATPGSIRELLSMIRRKARQKVG